MKVHLHYLWQLKVNKIQQIYAFKLYSLSIPQKKGQNIDYISHTTLIFLSNQILLRTTMSQDNHNSIYCKTQLSQPKLQFSERVSDLKIFFDWFVTTLVYNGNTVSYSVKHRYCHILKITVWWCKMHLSKNSWLLTTKKWCPILARSPTAAGI